MATVVETALLTAAIRARESSRRDPLVNDPLASALAGPEGRSLLGRMDRLVPPPSPFDIVPVRTWWIDERLGAISQLAAIQQVVLLGAGMDTRAFRMKCLERATVFELDRGELHAIKESRLNGVCVASAAKRVPITADLGVTSLQDLLAGTGFDPAVPSVWIAEGVFIYLDEGSVQRVLQEAAMLSPPGSWLLADMVDPGLFELETGAEARDLLRNEGIPLVAGVQHPLRLISECGWNATSRQLSMIARSVGRMDVAAPIGSPDGYLIVARRSA